MSDYKIPEGYRRSTWIEWYMNYDNPGKRVCKCGIVAGVTDGCDHACVWTSITKEDIEWN